MKGSLEKILREWKIIPFASEKYFAQGYLEEFWKYEKLKTDFQKVLGL